MKISSTCVRAFEFACHSAACAPPSAGGTGGSRPGGTGSSNKVHMAGMGVKYTSGKIKPTVAGRAPDFNKTNVFGGPKKPAEDRAKAGPMRDISNSTPKSAYTGPKDVKMMGKTARQLAILVKKGGAAGKDAQHEINDRTKNGVRGPDYSVTKADIVRKTLASYKAKK